MDRLNKIKENLFKKEKRITENFSNLQLKLWDAFVFLMIFTLVSIPFHFLLWLNWDTLPLQKFVASLVSYLLTLTGLSVTSNGYYVVMENLGTIKIVKDCLGWKSILALSGLIIATRKVKLKNKAIGIASGIVSIAIVNVLRLTSTFYFVAVYDLNFEIVHTFIWRWGLTFFVLLFWIVWLRKNNVIQS